MVQIKSIVLVLLSITALPSTAEKNAVRSRRLPVCDTLKGCYLVNINTRSEAILTGNDSYTLDPINNKGYSVRCDVSKDVGAELNLIKFFFDGKVRDELIDPRYLNGDSYGGQWINPASFLESCGVKTFRIEGRLGSSLCFSKQFSINIGKADGSCSPLAPISAPVTPPSRAPTKSPTAPVTLPSKAPTKNPTAPVTPLSKAPTKSPVNAPVSPPVSGPVTGLRLMFTGVNPSVPVMNLAFDTINVVDLRTLSLPSSSFSIDALVGANVKSVKFSNGQTETAAPMAYCGNNGSNFYTCSDLVLGSTVTVTVNAYSLAGGGGSLLGSRSTTIQIIRSSAPTAPTAPTPAPVAAPAIPPVPGCPVPKLLGTWGGANTNATVRYPIQVAEAQGAMIGNDFVITSGFKGGYAIATPETYALDMFTPGAPWRRMDDMPFPLGLTHLGVAVKGMKGYFCGGYIGGGHGIHNGSCFEYDHSIPPGMGQWTNFSSLPDGGRSGGGMIYDETMDALVYAAGAQRPIQDVKGAIDFQNTWMYSFANTAAGWVSKKDIPFKGNHMGFVTAKDDTGKEHHFFFGGQHGEYEETQNTDEMYEYDAVADTWTQRQSIPYPLGHAAASARAIGCGFIVAGGRINNGLTSAITYYDIPTNTWTKIGDLTHQIHTNVCVIANGFLRCETGWAAGTFSWRIGITV